MQDKFNPHDISDAWYDLVIPRQSADDLKNCMSVSTAWCKFYSEPKLGQRAIQTHFGISALALVQFETIVFNIAPDEKINYQVIYQGLHQLYYSLKHLDKFHPLFKYPKRHLPLLACCLGNPEVSEKLLPPTNKDIWDQVKLALLPLESHQIYLKGSMKQVEQSIEAGVAIECKNKLLNHLIRNGRIPLNYTFDLFVKMFNAAASEPFVIEDSSLKSLLQRKSKSLYAAAVDAFINFLWVQKIGFINSPKGCNQISALSCAELIRNGYIDYAKYLLTTRAC